MCGCRNPPVERRNRDSEVCGYISWRHSGSEQLLSRFDLAFYHLPFAPAYTPELASDSEAGLSPFDGEFTFHFGQAGHDVEEEASGGGPGVNCIGEAFELHTSFL